MKDTREQIRLTTQDMHRDLQFTRAQLGSLASFCLSVTGIKGRLQDVALEAAISSAAFLDYDAPTRRFVAGVEQNALLKLREDLKDFRIRLEGLDQSIGTGLRTTQQAVMLAAMEVNRGSASRNGFVSGIHVVRMFAIYDSYVDVLAQTLNLLGWLQRQKAAPEEIPSRPRSPLEGASERLELQTLPRTVAADPLTTGMLWPILKRDLSVPDENPTGPREP